MPGKLTVKKFGGTSVATTERIEFIAKQIVQNKKTDEQVVIVVSAMGDTTDELFELAYKITDKPSQREMDMLLTAGERISMSLLSLALQKYGAEAISFTGSQSGIITTCSHGNARIIDVRAFRIKEELDKGKIVIVAGFQGVSQNKEITTLGRGGSDTTAVALASYLNADTCEIFTDVDGVFSADPRFVQSSRMIDEITYDQMLTLAYAGAGVLHPRAVEFALEYNVTLEVKSSFTFATGTFIQEKVTLEKQNITSITGLKKVWLIKMTVSKNLSSFWKQFNEADIQLDHFSFENKKVIIFLDEPNYSKFRNSEISRAESEIIEAASIVPVGLRLDNDNDLINKIINILEFKNIDILAMVKVLHGIKFFIERENYGNALASLHCNLIAATD